MAAIPLTNLSELLQCELADSRALKTAPLDPQPTRGGGFKQFWWVDLAARQANTTVGDAVAALWWNPRLDYATVG